MSVIPNKERQMVLEFKDKISTSVKRPYDFAFSGKDKEQSPAKKEKSVSPEYLKMKNNMIK